MYVWPFTAKAICAVSIVSNATVGVLGWLELSDPSRLVSCEDQVVEPALRVATRTL